MSLHEYLQEDPQCRRLLEGAVLAATVVAAGIAVSGTLIYLYRARRFRQWPFAGNA